eukprot:3556-Hanusia_phi.AAC.1
MNQNLETTLELSRVGNFRRSIYCSRGQEIFLDNLQLHMSGRKISERAKRPDGRFYPSGHS